MGKKKEDSQTAEMTAISLTVEEARQRDVGRLIARINRQTMATLALQTGDIVEITGKKTSGAVAFAGFPEDKDQYIVRIDERFRSNIGVNLQDRVTVRKAIPQVAAVVALYPVSMTIPVNAHFESFIKHKLLNLPITVDDEIVVSPTPQRALLFKIISLRPPGICVVKSSTRFHINEAPWEEEEVGARFVTYNDIGGLKEVIQQVREVVELPSRHPEVLRRAGVVPPKAILLTGPPGCGKTLLVRAIAHETESNFISFSAPEMFSKYYGESERRLRSYFQEAEDKIPCILYIDQIDAIAQNRLYTRGSERNLVSQLLSLIDGIKPLGKIIIIGETNQPEVLDSALRRPGRFDRLIELPMPTETDRLKIFEIHTRAMKLSPDVQLSELASKTPGLVGADIAAICREAGLIAIRRYFPDGNFTPLGVPPETTQVLSISQIDFENAIKWFWETRKTRELYPDQVVLRIAENIIAQLASGQTTEILLSVTYPDPTTAQKVQDVLETLFKKQKSPESSGAGGQIYATNIPNVFFHERPEGTYWLVRKGLNPPNPTTLLT